MEVHISPSTALSSVRRASLVVVLGCATCVMVVSGWRLSAVDGRRGRRLQKKWVAPRAAALPIDALHAQVRVRRTGAQRHGKGGPLDRGAERALLHRRRVERYLVMEAG